MKPNRIGGIRRFAPAVSMPAAAFAVHQLRYWLAFHGGAGVELERQGHSYLHSVVPWLVVLLALGAGGFLVALGRAFSGRRSAARYTASLTALWAICAVSLVAIYMTQESLEGLFATGHPGGLVGIFGYGGWWAIPAAGCVALVLAAIFHGARWVLDEVAERHASRPLERFSANPVIPPPRDAALLRLAPLAYGWSGRGPPR